MNNKPRCLLPRPLQEQGDRFHFECIRADRRNSSERKILSKQHTFSGRGSSFRHLTTNLVQIKEMMVPFQARHHIKVFNTILTEQYTRRTDIQSESVCNAYVSTQMIRSHHTTSSLTSPAGSDNQCTQPQNE